MKYLLLVTLSLSSVQAKSQTKDETQNWIRFNFDKYFSSNYNDYGRNLSFNANQSYIYSTQRISFSGNNLILQKSKYEEIKGINKPLLPIEDIIDTILLSEVINVEVDTFQIITWIHPPMQIKFTFSGDGVSHYKTYSVRTYDNIKSKSMTDGYSMTYDINSDDFDLKKGNWKDRFLKAFQSLVVLSGGKVVTDAF